MELLRYNVIRGGFAEESGGERRRRRKPEDNTLEYSFPGLEDDNIYKL